LRIGHLRFCFAVCLIGTFISAGVALADWDVGDAALYYQLPDPTGWDVYSEWRNGVANDWVADIDAPITDIHFWGSWKGDVVGDMGDLLLQIFDNDTSGTFAKPGDQLWEGVFSNDDLGQDNDYTTRLYDTGLQGFYDPRYTDHWYPNNHYNMYQYNINTIDNPFIQEAGQTYWLQISTNYEGCDWGWKTSLDVTGNTSVFWDTYWWCGGYYQQLLQPNGYCNPRTPLDVAFVLTTPEPATLFLMAIGAAAVLRKRRK
jgi:hypothetical protein